MVEVTGFEPAKTTRPGHYGDVAVVRDRLRTPAEGTFGSPGRF